MVAAYNSIVEISGYIENIINTQTDDVWDSKSCYQSEVDDTGEHALVSFSFFVNGKDVADDYDLDTVDIDYIADSQCDYVSNGSAYWSDITVTYKDDAE